MKLIIKQLDFYFTNISNIKNIQIPREGWVKTVRQAIDMSTSQLAKRLQITRQSVTEIEQREAEGSITLKTLREVAEVMDLQLFYVLIPKDGTLEMLIERKAKELATEIVMRTSQSMKLENQENSKKRIKEAIKERTERIKLQSLKIVWDRK
jgi:predicted DNA-binding mobile mystery protein A